MFDKIEPTRKYITFINITLEHTANDVLLVKTKEYDTMPRYFIYGGYVFSPLSRNLLAIGRNKILRYYATQWPTVGCILMHRY